MKAFLLLVTWLMPGQPFSDNNVEKSISDLSAICTVSGGRSDYSLDFQRQ